MCDAPPATRLQQATALQHSACTNKTTRISRTSRRDAWIASSGTVTTLAIAHAAHLSDVEMKGSDASDFGSVAMAEPHAWAIVASKDATASARASSLNANISLGLGADGVVFCRNQ